jgi:putative transposase
MMTRRLRVEGIVIGRHWVRRLMKDLGLVVNVKRIYRVTTDSRHMLVEAENLLNRAFYPDAPNRV